MSVFRETVERLASGFDDRAELKAEIARLQDLVAKFQRGEPSDKFQEHGA